MLDKLDDRNAVIVLGPDSCQIAETRDQIDVSLDGTFARRYHWLWNQVTNALRSAPALAALLEKAKIKEYRAVIGQD